MILAKVMKGGKGAGTAPLQAVEKPPAGVLPYFGRSYRMKTSAGQMVSEESARCVATAYRAASIISDDIAAMPFQQFRKNGSSKEQVAPDGRVRNVPYLLEISPNIWGWTPFQFKKRVIEWLIWEGNSYVWMPPVWPFQMMILPADVTRPVYDKAGDLWYTTRFSNGKMDYIPGTEVLQLLINPDETGQCGRGILQFARESIGRQLGAYETESSLFAQGLNPAAFMKVAGNLDRDGRDKYRQAYGEAISGSGNAYKLAVFDNRVTDFQPISMKLVDAQFLELIQATDQDIANFFGMPLHMLNMGKESYNSNEQKYLEYLNSTLNSYLVQFEQAARIKWLPLAEQGNNYFRFIRESLLRMDAKSRAATNEVLIRSGQRSPNETREKDDYSGYEGGDAFFMTKNYADVNETGDENAKTN